MIVSFNWVYAYGEILLLLPFPSLTLSVVSFSPQYQDIKTEVNRSTEMRNFAKGGCRIDLKTPITIQVTAWHSLWRMDMSGNLSPEDAYPYILKNTKLISAFYSRLKH